MYPCLQSHTQMGLCGCVVDSSKKKNIGKKQNKKPKIFAEILA